MAIHKLTDYGLLNTLTVRPSVTSTLVTSSNRGEAAGFASIPAAPI